MAKAWIVGVWLVLSGGVALAGDGVEAATGVVAGEVREKGTRAPVAGIPVIVRGVGGELEVLTDADGRFTIEVSEAEVTIDIFTGGYEPLDRKVKAQLDRVAAEAARVILVLTPSGLDAYRTVVSEVRGPKAASVVVLAGPELSQVAGTFGDPTRVVGALPGVARPMFGTGDFAVRGANPEHTGYFIDGHPTRYLYHLLGGPGVVDPALAGDMAFYPGGYPASFGRVAAAVAAVSTAELPSDRWHLDVQLDVLKAGATLTVPFADGRGVAAFSFRRSYFDLLLPLISDGISLAYTDYQARVSYRFSDSVRAQLYMLGADDHAGFVEGEGEREERVEIGLGFHRVGLSLEVDVNPCLRWTTRVAGDYERANNRVTEPGSPDITTDDDAHVLHATTSLQWRAMRGYSLRAGLDFLVRDGTFNRQFPAGAPLGEPTPAATDWVVVAMRRAARDVGIAPFLSAEMAIAKGLTLMPGLRADIDLERGAVTLDPRLALRWRFANDWTLSVMGAVAHQPPAAEVVAEPFGAAVGPVEALQSSVGIEWARDGWFMSLTGFYQRLSGLTVASDAALDADGEVAKLGDDGEGRGFGAELMMRKRYGERVHGWLSYTLSRAERRAEWRKGDVGDWQLFSSDQTHVLTLAVSVKLGAEWSVGTRFQLSSGNPYRVVETAQYDADGDVYVPVYSRELGRMKVYHRLDLRVDKTWRFDDWMLQAYLDVQNVYAAENAEVLTYNYNYSRVRGGFSLPILPTLGIRMVF